MKKLIFTILLICVSTATAQIPPQLDSLIARLFVRLDMPATGTAKVTATTAWQILNDAQSSVCKHFNAYQKLDTIIVWGGPEGVALNNDVLRIEYVERMVGDLYRLPMIEVRQREAWEKVSNLADTGYAQSNLTLPRYWHSEGTRLFTTPKNTKEQSSPDSLLVAYWAVSHNMTWGGDSTDIDSDYREALILKACAAVTRKRQGANSAEAAAWESAYMDEVKNYGRLMQK